MLDEDQIRKIVQEEIKRAKEEEQNKCSHFESGTLQPDFSVVCNSCEKQLEYK
jgi:hypothetical protein